MRNLSSLQRMKWWTHSNGHRWIPASGDPRWSWRITGKSSFDVKSSRLAHTDCHIFCLQRNQSNLWEGDCRTWDTEEYSEGRGSGSSNWKTNERKTELFSFIRREDHQKQRNLRSKSETGPNRKEGSRRIRDGNQGRKAANSRVNKNEREGGKQKKVRVGGRNLKRRVHQSTE